jgi:hypothetical protein
MQDRNHKTVCGRVARPDIRGRRGAPSVYEGAAYVRRSARENLRTSCRRRSEKFAKKDALLAHMGDVIYSHACYLRSDS